MYVSVLMKKKDDLLDRNVKVTKDVQQQWEKLLWCMQCSILPPFQIYIIIFIIHPPSVVGG